ncbi:segregation/condensation protein A [Gilvimarinus agarilyticus]|uniref:Segregation and condensation protein A n=1 Tax=Reichenbachiella agariperforans TaxID=156994 RepID=A0A1M6VX77_REIAG|nr:MULTISPECIES: segregation/condensation protein A [Reichenbachiella]MBU2885906.1 segregation/condensation protein A [Gilvimarinus agarilyticus]MBU2915289.1 segregation/condensation protein A [Reichenbachiella agariperforans]RJE70947.1 chromosome segregation protein ScpA [Reichenbachiella sp. MSK19-1]SHK85925.1 condensin subunit ScpA [Reichenbachiella agariperforans]
MKFEVKLPLFEGPFDLLLFFIERDELDIYDIPISQIANDFLDYVHQLEKLNIEVASEFILVAATLMRIKAKMLLPRPVIDEEGNEIDPREELVRHLLEYKRYKSVIAELVQLETDRMDRERRGNITREIKALAESTNVEAELQNLDLFKILKVYQKVMQRYEMEKNKVIHQVVQYPYTIADQKSYILDSVRASGRMAFTDLIKENPEKIYVIFNFLAILELLQLQQVKLHLGEGFNNFWIEGREEVAVD